MENLDQENLTMNFDDAPEEEQENLFETLPRRDGAIDIGASAEPDSTPAANPRVEESAEIGPIPEVHPRGMEPVGRDLLALPINARPVGRGINARPVGRRINARPRPVGRGIIARPVGRGINARAVGRGEVHPVINPRPVGEVNSEICHDPVVENPD